MEDGDQGEKGWGIRLERWMRMCCVCQRADCVREAQEGTVSLQVTVLLLFFSLIHQTSARPWNIDGHLGIVRF